MNKIYKRKKPTFYHSKVNDNKGERRLERTDLRRTDSSEQVDGAHEPDPPPLYLCPIGQIDRVLNL